MSGKKVGKIGKAQFKLSFILIYYTMTGVMGLVTHTHYRVRDSSNQIMNYLVCETLSGDCTQLDIVDTFSRLSSTVIVMFALMPVVMVIFSINLLAFREKCGRCVKK